MPPKLKITIVSQKYPKMIIFMSCVFDGEKHNNCLIAKVGGHTAPRKRILLSFCSKRAFPCLPCIPYDSLLCSDYQ